MSLARGAGLAVLLLAGGCATQAAPTQAANPPASCPAGMAERSTLTAFFGRNGSRNGREFLRVPAEAWERFRRAELTPRFPAGSTILDAVGTWQGQTLAEPTKVVLLVVPSETQDAALQSLQAAIDIYRRDFQQQSVGILVTQACAAGF
ncbi:DUF3574 domain-containing protein [Paracraurococcus lichenis]|uniref:DUF3574 domain-containing protein n=1 Tax=Paracraurococcus lichenis TaxID=3064888 RepID=A0ABT9E5B7_9PROT|nr:DUF3574 domain-containing protein [Paracraurococcus sp. LOR1-02]MDO9711338.1 DUF3574 domain-containing protein [Paracraurococcus sp. LOR1-02]